MKQETNEWGAVLSLKSQTSLWSPPLFILLTALEWTRWSHSQRFPEGVVDQRLFYHGFLITIAHLCLLFAHSFHSRYPSFRQSPILLHDLSPGSSSSLVLCSAYCWWHPPPHWNAFFLHWLHSFFTMSTLKTFISKKFPFLRMLSHRGPRFMWFCSISKILNSELSLYHHSLVFVYLALPSLPVLPEHLPFLALPLTPTLFDLMISLWSGPLSPLKSPSPLTFY